MIKRIFIFMHALFTVGNAQNLSSNNVLEVEYVKDKLWVLTKDGLSYTKDGKNFSSAHSELSTYSALGNVGDTVWVSSDRKIFLSSDNFATQEKIEVPFDDENDTIGFYGNEIPQRILPFTENRNNAFFQIVSLDIHPETKEFWIACFDGGLRRSKDKKLWKRVFLPPETMKSLEPSPELKGLQLGVEQFIDSEVRGDKVYQVRKVFFDSKGNLWVGTKGGLLKSENSTHDNPSWIKYNYEFGGLHSNEVIDVTEQVFNNTSLIWTSTIKGFAQDQKNGISFSTSGGENWKNTWDDQAINQVKFKGKKIFAVGSNGIYIADDTTADWTLISSIQDKNVESKVVSMAASFNDIELDVQNGRIWVATEEGLLLSDDDGITWMISRADKPVDNVILTYAYPNPFKPSRDHVVRIRYKSIANSPVTIKVLDFSMRLVRSLINQKIREKDREYEELWDGTNTLGAIVANGVYFYVIETPGHKLIYGKILVIK